MCKERETKGKPFGGMYYFHPDTPLLVSDIIIKKIEKAVLSVLKTEHSEIIESLPCPSFESATIRSTFGGVTITLKKRKE